MWVSEDLVLVCVLGGWSGGGELRNVEGRKEKELIEKSRTGGVESARFY